MSLRFRGKQLIFDGDTWPKCGWTNEVGWQGCKRDAQLAQFDEDGAVIFRCTPHVIEDSDSWPVVEPAEVTV